MPNDSEFELDAKKLTVLELSNKYSLNQSTVRRRLKKLRIKPIGGRGSPEFRSKMSAIQKAAWSKPETRISAARKAKEHWANKDYRSVKTQQAVDQWADDSIREKIVLSITDKHKDKSYKDNATKGLKAVWSKPGSLSKNQQNVWHNPQLRVKHSKIMKEVVNRPEVRSKMELVWGSSEFRLRLAKQRTNMPSINTRPHRKVCSILDSLGVKYNTEVPIGPFLFDIFIPSCNLLIEVQGNYWHTLPGQISRDKAKATYIHNHFPDRKLKYIWEHECLQENKVLEKVKYWLNIVSEDVTELNFDDLVVQICDDVKVCDTFLYDWHYQHHGRHGLDIVCKFKDDIVALARFCAPSRQEISTSEGIEFAKALELSRFCIHPKYQKKNLGTWFLSRCRFRIVETKPNITHLVSFADSTYGHVGTIYKADNWNMARVSEPNYSYVDKDGWVMHKKTLWNHSKKMSMSETEYANRYGFTKIWGKEKYKYIKKLR